MKIHRNFIQLVAFFTVLPILLLSQPVIHHPNPQEPLQQRWQWALEESKQKAFENDVWIGYSIQRLMGEKSHIGSFHYPSQVEVISLQELIYGKPERTKDSDLSDEEILKKTAKRALEKQKNANKPDKKINKEVALLFRLTPFDVEPARIEEVKLSNLSLSVDLKGSPLFWLGKSDDKQSVALLKYLFRSQQSPEVGEDLITAAAIHDFEEEAVSFLTEILNGNYREELREDAAFWLGQQNNAKALQLLTETARTDDSDDVREKAVFAVSQMDLEPATDTLIELARHADNLEVRERAVFWLSQKASRKAVNGLESIAVNQDDYEIQTKAVFALYNLPDGTGIPKLIKIAKTHRNPKIRKKAIFWLGQSKNPQALNALVEIVQKK